jgi:hypothetical protein
VGPLAVGAVVVVAAVVEEVPQDVNAAAVTVPAISTMIIPSNRIFFFNFFSSLY